MNDNEPVVGKLYNLGYARSLHNKIVLVISIDRPEDVGAVWHRNVHFINDGKNDFLSLVDWKAYTRDGYIWEIPE